VKVADIKRKMIEEVRRVRWFPDWAGSRQHEWTENLRDWCLSRQRYWGTPAPIWRCEKCGHWTVVGSSEELRGSDGYAEGMDLHRPAIDRVVLACDKCRAPMRRVPDTVDVWFDSGVASWASLGYPSREDEFKRWWPMNWIVEGPDQTRGWFSSQLTAGAVAFDRAPYESVLMHGWVTGPDGRQMHKSLGNFIEPSEIVSKFGVDPLRFYVLSVNAPWDDITFQEEGVRTAQRTLNILWNVLRFATTYMVLDRFDPAKVDPKAVEATLRPEDRWLRSRLESLKASADAAMETYSLHRVYRGVESFILDDLSRWYVKLVRSRTWVEATDPDKAAAYHVLYEALESLAALLAPAVPHIAEAMYQRLGGTRLSVHMLDWPTAREEHFDTKLEASMAIVQELIEIASKERQKGGRKLRWPLRLIAVKPTTPEAAAAVESLQAIVLDQANAKEFVVLKPNEEFPGTVLKAKADLAAIGRAYKALLPKVAKVLEARPPEEIRKALEKGPYEIGIEGQVVTIEPSMVRFERRMPDQVVAAETPHGELYLDLRVTPELQAEAYAREIVRRIQQMRKEIDLEVDDFIVTTVKANKDFAAMLDREKELIARETRSRTLSFTDKPVDEEYIVEWNDVGGQSVTIGVTPLHASEALREFTRVPGITPAKAMALFDAGYKSLAALRQATKQELVAVDGLDPTDASRIPDALAKAPPTPMPCSVCGAPLPRDARRCPRCGEPTTEEADWCSRCGSAVMPGADACTVCGLPVVRERKGAPPSRVPCASCGEMIPARAPRCPSCGAFREEPPAQKAEAEVRPVDEASARLRGSSTYLVKEASSEGSYRLFVEAMEGGRKGLCVTRVFPAKVRERIGSPDLPILWLSNVGKEDAIRPKDLEKLSLAVEQFLTRQKGVLLLDGIEYLVTNNNFLTVLRLLQSIRDQVAIHNAVLLLSVNPSTFDAHQLTLLEREVDQVIVPPSGPADRP
jgi:isoleucyl-tRNA synthetase